MLEDRWPEVEHMPEFNTLATLKQKSQTSLRQLFQSCQSSKSENGFRLLCQMLEYDPHRRICAQKALSHPYFAEIPKPGSK
jgi:serine/threonine protein kinase